MRMTRFVCVFACLVLLPAVAHAQATLAGTVRDPSGAVLPGVSVEAASAASEPRERSAPAKRRARERAGESEGRSPSDL